MHSSCVGTSIANSVQVGKFVVGQPESENANERINEDQVLEDMRFPAQFKGKGVRDHRYHVFNRPRYYE